MEKKEKGRSIYYIMRVLHRDIGFITLGLTLVYALSGVILVYRNTNFLMSEKTTVKQLKQDLSAKDLSEQLLIRNFQILKEEGDMIYFKDGSYNTTTGEATISRKEYPDILNKLVNFHKITGNNKWSFFSTIYGILLLFLAVSSLFMYKFRSKKSKRGIALTGLGIALTIAFLLLM
ncbi:MAG: hypothetical protein PHR52_01985 [Fermentimonas sp.]|nr:hypothetical protein [Fermentimonas sp.]